MGSFGDATLPNGVAEMSAGGGDVYATRFSQGEPLLLPAGEFVIALDESFELGGSSNDWAGAWIEDSQDDWFRSTQRATVGGYSAEINGRAEGASLTMTDSVDLSSFLTATLSFDWYIEGGFDTGEYVAADVWDGSQWVEVARRSGDVDYEDSWNTKTNDFAPELRTAEFKLRFRSQVSQSREDANIDNIRIFGVREVTAANNAPIADAGDLYAGVEDGAIVFDASSASDADGDNLTYQWDFGDGASLTTTEPTASHTYAYGGTFDVLLTVSDGRGGVDVATTTASIAEVNDAPVANAGGPYDRLVNEPVALDASASFDFNNQDGTAANDQALSSAWDFDNDGTADEVSGNPTTDYAFAAAGSYEVTFTVDDGLQSSQETVVVTISEPPAGIEMYVADIRFDSKRGGKDYRAVVEIRDVNGNTVAGVDLSVDFAGQTHQVTTDSNGIARTSWQRKFASGDYYANAYDLALEGYVWDSLSLELEEDDSDGDGLPDDIIAVA